MEIQHRPGRSHGNGDALSRRPCEDCTYCSRQEKKEDDTVETNHKQSASFPVVSDQTKQLECCTLDTQGLKDAAKESKS